MSKLTYDAFIEQVKQYQIFPFSDFVPEYPSLTTLALGNVWHDETDTDPWPWRIKIVEEGIAAYGKFFGSKACFIHVDLFPIVSQVLSLSRTADQRYRDGLLSTTAYRIFTTLAEQGNMDSRQLRKETGLHATEHKKEYEKALVELQNHGDIVITGSRQNTSHSGWNSMCYELSGDWLRSVNRSVSNNSFEDSRRELASLLSSTCTGRAYAYFAKKLQLTTK